jgi:hypothetical protein
LDESISGKTRQRPPPKAKRLVCNTIDGKRRLPVATAFCPLNGWTHLWSTIPWQNDYQPEMNTSFGKKMDD